MYLCMREKGRVYPPCSWKSTFSKSVLCSIAFLVSIPIQFVHNSNSTKPTLHNFCVTLPVLNIPPVTLLKQLITHIPLNLPLLYCFWQKERKSMHCAEVLFYMCIAGVLPYCFSVITRLRHTLCWFKCLKMSVCAHTQTQQEGRTRRKRNKESFCKLKKKGERTVLWACWHIRMCVVWKQVDVCCSHTNRPHLEKHKQASTKLCALE